MGGPTQPNPTRERETKEGDCKPVVQWGNEAKLGVLDVEGEDQGKGLDSDLEVSLSQQPAHDVVTRLPVSQVDSP